jgi:enamidase
MGNNLLLKNIGTLVSGNIERPLIDADAVWIEDGLIRRVGFLKDMQETSAQTVIDCAGTTVTPGLIDSHVHPVLMDFSPRQKQTDFLESEVHGGVTTASPPARSTCRAGRPTRPASRPWPFWRPSRSPSSGRAG